MTCDDNLKATENLIDAPSLGFRLTLLSLDVFYREVTFRQYFEALRLHASDVADPRFMGNGTHERSTPHPALFS